MGRCRVSGAYGRGRGRTRRSRCRRRPWTRTPTWTRAAASTAADVAAAMDRAAAVGVTRAVTIADDLAAARWAVQAAHWDDRVAAAVALHPTRTAADHRRRPRRDRAAGRRPAGGRRRRDRARLLLGLLPAGRPAGVVPPAHRPGQAARQAADDPRPGRARRRAAHPGRGGRPGDGGLPLLLRGRGDGAASASRPATCCRSPGRSPSATRRRCARPRWRCPAEQLLVETDAPFLTPHPHRGRANEPYCLPWTVRALAALRGVSDERLADGRPAHRRAGVRARRAAAQRPRRSRLAKAVLVRRSPTAARRSRRVARQLRRSRPVTVDEIAESRGGETLPSTAVTVVRGAP